MAPRVRGRAEAVQRQDRRTLAARRELQFGAGRLVGHRFHRGVVGPAPTRHALIRPALELRGRWLAVKLRIYSAASQRAPILGPLQRLPATCNSSAAHSLRRSPSAFALKEILSATPRLAQPP